MTRLAVLRQAKGLTQGQLAAELGVSLNTVTRWEMDGDNATRPARPTLRLLALILEAPIEEIEFGGDGMKRTAGRPRKSTP